MILTEHRVENYRNIEQAEFRPGPGLTVLCGRNGQGKTNLLESVWLLSGAKSFRGSRDPQLVRRGEPYAVISSVAKREDGEADVAWGYRLLETAGKKRGFLISGGEVDTERMAKILLDEYRSGKLGRFTLEVPEETEQPATSE